MQGNDSFRLIVRRGPQPNQTYDLNKDVVTIGRDITNDIVINDPEVSRHHLRFTLVTSGYNIEDLGSTNGTFINGQRISGSKPLNNGDMIGLGETVTLGYEMVRTTFAGAPEDGGGAQVTAPGQSAYEQPAPPQQPSYQQPQQPAYSQPPATQDPTPYGGQPAGNDYADAFSGAAPQPPQGSYYDQQGYDYEAGGGNNTTRIVLIGCAAVLVLCCCATIGLSIYIDSQCLWWDIPVLGDTLRAVGQEPSLGFEACARRYGA
jgi:pSer/pThr/pTyr-binding forkhead associated (FHA) protein